MTGRIGAECGIGPYVRKLRLSFGMRLHRNRFTELKRVFMQNRPQ